MALQTSPLPDVDTFRAFFRGPFEAASAEIEETDAIPEAALRGAIEVGTTRLSVPLEHGGFALRLTDLLPYLEAAATGPAAGRMLAHLNNGIWRPLAEFGTPEQRRLIDRSAAGEVAIAFALTERTGGTGRDLHSRAERDGDGWRLFGEKHLITFADRADYFVLTARSDERGAPDSFTAFLVPRHAPGFEIELGQRTMGLAGSGHGWLRYDGMRLPDTDRLGAVGDGLRVAFSFLDYSRISLSCCMVGLAARALEESVGYAKRRVTFGQAIARRESVQGHLAEMQADLEAGRGLVRSAAARYDRGEPVTAEAATAKLFCLNMVGRVTDHALRVHGGYGYTRQAPIERIYRDARGFWFEEGTAEIQQKVIARALLT
ncbi:MAG: acyl-CoA dehydrogenase family protein [Candidatus Dormibacteraceae bacterium]